MNKKQRIAQSNIDNNRFFPTLATTTLHLRLNSPTWLGLAGERIRGKCRVGRQCAQLQLTAHNITILTADAIHYFVHTSCTTMAIGHSRNSIPVFSSNLDCFGEFFCGSMHHLHNRARGITFQTLYFH